MIGKTLDNLIGVFSPRWAASRAAHRHYYSRIQAANGVHSTIEKMMGSRRDAGPEAGRIDRLHGITGNDFHENDLDRRKIHNTRWRSWKLYRNNPQARKIRRTLCAKVIGRGLVPSSQATNQDGSPDVEFRKRARRIWNQVSAEIDWRGKPGSGGQHLRDMSKVALGCVMLSGGTLYRFHTLTASEQRKRDLLLPFQLQLIHDDRIDERKHGEKNWHGVALDDSGRVKGFWLLPGGVIDKDLREESTFVSIQDVKHLYANEDIDQLLGSPWFGAALLTMDDRHGYERNELIASEMASCYVGKWRPSGGSSGRPGLRDPSGDRELTDAHGNPVTRLQPGMLLNIGANGDFDITGGERPNNMAGEFLAHWIRSEAVSMPGVKASTLTGDYRNSSFSSERSADNDIWPEIEELQDWFSCCFCQPIYEAVIKVAVTQGLFADIVSTQEFNARRRAYLEANWQGPVARSINPKDDAAAARMRVQNSTSSPQREAAKLGADWRELLDETAEFIEEAGARGLPEDIWQQALGIDQTDSAEPAEPSQEPTEEQQDEAARNRFRASGLIGMNHG